MADRLLATSDLGQHLAIARPKVDAGPYGIAIRKGDTQVRDAIQSALRALMADGTYNRILAHWNLERFARRNRERRVVTVPGPPARPPAGATTLGRVIAPHRCC